MFLRLLPRLGVILLLSFALSVTASAQYGGGPGGGTSSTSYGSNGKAIGIGLGVAAGVAVGVVLYVHHRHHKAANKAQPQTSVITRSEISGMSFKNENELYRTAPSDTLQSGRRFGIQGGVAASNANVSPPSPSRSFGIFNTPAAALGTKTTGQSN